MFRHQGKSRTFSHNLRLATLLSFVAGVVNVTGVLEIQVLTTNVTGHFAYFSEQIMEHQYLAAFAFFVFILFFLLGAFTSNFIVELMTKTKPEFSHVIPLSIEIFLLFIIGLFGASWRIQVSIAIFCFRVLPYFSNSESQILIVLRLSKFKK
nr:DUF1275 family protein [uncultured Flavobacterium sp.]